MCLVDSSTSVDIDSEDLNASQYKCLDCNSRFKALGKKVSCTSCGSSNVRKI
ncbi:MAG: hypothetical protein OIN88_02355 [Candidatus Methanoperedens sp.]|nr:hypothetical protein [Candidatus Methanoperedens sp.]MCZ7359233.1 hypothetical protein [Candidatus Methanoperedens sp.]HLB71444.1 hypothetical protein [Candidatus Methanoperedens sp.]